jgi:hypothetical protein
MKEAIHVEGTAKAERPGHHRVSVSSRCMEAVLKTAV